MIDFRKYAKYVVKDADMTLKARVEFRKGDKMNTELIEARVDLKQAEKKGTDVVKKGKTKGIFDVEKDDTLEKQIFKQDEDLSKLLEKKIELRDKQLKRLDKELLGLDLNDEEEKLPSKKTLDDANQEFQLNQDL